QGGRHGLAHGFVVLARALFREEAPYVPGRVIHEAPLVVIREARHLLGEDLHGASLWLPAQHHEPVPPPVPPAGPPPAPRAVAPGNTSLCVLARWKITALPIPTSTAFVRMMFPSSSAPMGKLSRVSPR